MKVDGLAVRMLNSVSLEYDFNPWTRLCIGFLCAPVHWIGKECVFLRWTSVPSGGEHIHQRIQETYSMSLCDPERSDWHDIIQTLSSFWPTSFSTTAIMAFAPCNWLFYFHTINFLSHLVTLIASNPQVPCWLLCLVLHSHNVIPLEISLCSCWLKTVQEEY